VLAAGVRTLTATFTPTDQTKYLVVTQTVPLTVNKVPLTVTAASTSRNYGANNPSFSATISGFVNGDTASAVTGFASVASSATPTSVVGSYSITAALGTLAADNYTFTFVPGTLTVNKASLTVTADNKSKTAGAANPTLTATIGGFVGGDTAASAVTGSPTLSTTAVTASPAGNYPISVVVGTLGSTNYAFSTFVPGTLTVTGLVKLDQVITFGPLASKVVGAAPFALTATASSGLAVSYTSSNPAVATVSGSTVTILTVGSTVITASQPGDATYNAATPVPQTLTVTGKLNQTITFAALPAKEVGNAPFALTATASSGLAVTYTSSNPAVATVSGSTVTILAAGTTTITASQAGNGTYNAATPVAQTLTVTAVSTCTTSVLWLAPVSYNTTQWCYSYAPIKFTIQQCCAVTTTPSGNQSGCNDRDDDGSWDWKHWGHSDDHTGSNVTCHHGSNGRSSDDSNCRHDSDHYDDENHDGCVNLRDKSVIISVYEVGSSAPAVQYKYGTGSPNPPDYIIDGDCKYQLNVPTARGSHRYHIDIYRFPTGATVPVLVGSKEISTWSW
jgi:hypothetical protein